MLKVWSKFDKKIEEGSEWVNVLVTVGPDKLIYELVVNTGCANAEKPLNL